MRTLTSYPENPRRLLAGTDSGLFRSEDDGRTFAELDTPIGDRQIWSLAIDPRDPETLFLGSQPEAFRSRDGGQSWDVISPDLTTNDKSRQGISGGLTPDNLGVEYCCVISVSYTHLTLPTICSV